MKQARSLLFFSLGFFSLLAQALIAREFLISFGGNELSLGFFYFFWFLWVGIGALISLFNQSNALGRNFLKIAPFFTVCALVEFFCLIDLHALSGVNWWEIFKFDKVLFSLLLFSAPVPFFTGAAFSLCAIWAKDEDSGQTLVAKIFSWEALGGVCAGGLFTFFAARLFAPTAVLIIAALIFLACIVRVSILRRDKPAIFINLFFSVLFLFMAFNHGVVNNFARTLRMHNFLAGAKFKDEIYTPYRHLLVGDYRSQTVVLSDGRPLLSSPETVDSDGESALFFAESDHPKTVVIFGLGAENLIKALLRFNVESITYVVEDKFYYDTVYKNLSGEAKRIFSDRRINLAFVPARKFLASNPQKFDLAVVYAGEPSDLVANSFFTREFYALLKNNLNSRAVVAARINASENFISEEASAFGASLYYTLNGLFDKIAISPGQINWFFAGGISSGVTDDPVLLKSRIKGEISPDSSFQPEGFDAIFLKERVDFVKNAYINNRFFKQSGLFNRDLNPLMFFFNLIILASSSAHALFNILKGSLGAGLLFFTVLIFTFFGARVWFLKVIENQRQNRILFNSKMLQFFTGFLGFSLNLLLIYFLQIKLGTIFQLIGLVSGIFMLGLSLGGFGGQKISRKLGSVNTAVGVLFYGLILIGAVYFFLIFLNFSSLFIFIGLFFGAGIFTGAAYPVCAGFFEESGFTLNRTVAYVELFDYAGAALSASLVGVFMAPVLGLKGTLAFLFLVDLVILFLFILEIAKNSFVKKEKILIYGVSQGFIWFVFAVLIAFILGNAVLKNAQTPFTAPLKNKNVLNSLVLAHNIHGFGGPINLDVTCDKDGKINKIEILSHNETPEYVSGFPKFLAQFTGKKIDSGFALHKNIDAMTGASISSQAVVDTVNQMAKSGTLPVPQRFDWRLPVWFTIFSLFFITAYFVFPGRVPLRTFYLLFVVMTGGVVLNLTLSYFNLGVLLDFNFFSIAGGVLLFGIALGLLFGPVWCGWFCPFGALQELITFPRWLRAKSVIEMKARNLRYALLLIFILFYFFGCKQLFAYDPLATFFAKNHGPALYVLGAVALIFSILYPRFWCRYFCISGAFLSFFNKMRLPWKKLRRYNACPFEVKGSNDLTCFQCDRCLAKKASEPAIENNLFFKVALAVTIFFVIFFMASGLKPPSINNMVLKNNLRSEAMAKVDKERINDLIAHGKLSDHEALYYEKRP
jgi:spermidine synthase